MSYTIRYNRSTTHIEGCDAATQSTGEERGGVVEYYAQSACGSLTRYGHSMAVGKTYEDAAEALEAGRANAAASGRKFCKNCEIAAKWAVANAPFDPESDEFKAEKKRVNDELIARSEAAKTKYANLSPTAQALAEAGDARDEAMQAAYDAEGTDREAYADAKYEAADAAHKAASRAHRAARRAYGDDVKPEPFTFEYDAMAGILIADALREKAKTHRDAAKGYRTNADLGTGLQGFYAEQARLADNNAQLLEDAADKIHKPVKAALANDMAHAIERTEVKARRAKRQQTGMDSLRDMLKLS